MTDVEASKLVLPWDDSGKPRLAEKLFLKALRAAGGNAANLDDFELWGETLWLDAPRREWRIPQPCFSFCQSLTTRSVVPQCGAMLRVASSRDLI